MERYEQLERDQAAAEAELPAARTDLADKQAQAEEAATAQATLDSHKATLARALEGLARAQAAVTERAELVTAAEEAAVATEAAQHKLTAAQDKAKEEAAAKDSLEKQLAEAKEDYAAARSTLKQARRLQDRQRFEQLSARLESLDALAAEVSRLDDAPEVEVLVGSWDVEGGRLLDAVAVMDRLRSPGGCAWVAAQDHASLVPFVLEEAHEVTEALEAVVADPDDAPPTTSPARKPIASDV